MEVVEYQDTHKAIVEIDPYSFGFAYYMLGGIGTLLSWPASEYCYLLELGMTLVALLTPFQRETIHSQFSVSMEYNATHQCE